jgi:competence protein ComEA
VPDLSTATQRVVSRGHSRIPRTLQEDTMNRLLMSALIPLVLSGSPLFAQRATKPAAAPRVVASSTEIINLNTATAAQLSTLPGIGPKTADLIVQYRQKNGAFKKIEEIMNVRGVGEKSFLKLKSRLTVVAAKAGE